MRSERKLRLPARWLRRGVRVRLGGRHPAEVEMNRITGVRRHPRVAVGPEQKGGSMNKHVLALGGASLLLSVSVIAAQGQVVPPTTPPDPPTFSAQGTPNFVSAKDIFVYKALPEYHEPQWVTDQFVKTGKLPPVKDRLPKEPLVYLDRQHARRHRRLRRRDAPRHRRPAARAGTTPPARSRAGAASTSACTSA